MIIWINGSFGAGKTSVTGELPKARPTLAVFDTEQVGYMLGPSLRERKPVADFQDWVSWRRLVVATLAELTNELGTDIVLPQTVVVEQYWSEITSSLSRHHIALSVFTLDVSPEQHQRRINSDQVESQAAGWRRERRPDFDAALPWLRNRTQVIETTNLSPDQVANTILTAVDGHP